MARIHEHTVNIAAPLTLVSAIPLAMQGDAEADELILHVVNGRESADMSGYTVGGYLERADGIRVMLKGSVTADVVQVKLQEACYRVPGAYKAFVRLTKTTGEKMTLFLFAGRIESEGDGEIVDEEDTLPSVEELIAMIEEIDRAIAGANTARDGANAAATRADAAAAEALKAAENAGRAEKAANDAAYEANAAADAADEAAVGASAWAKATMEAETLPEGSKPTISVEKNVNGGNVIRVGIPAGKTGNTGETGATPQITFEVETGAAGSDVKVEQSGTAETPHIKLTIPRGDTGAVEGVDYYEGDPAPLGTANPGTSNGLARGNHVHPMPNADDVGARPANWMPTAADVGALGKNETAANANQLNGKDAKFYSRPRNLLDNSNFEIAQAGYSGLHGTKTYACDRWEQYTETVIEKVDAGLKIAKNSTGSISSMWQYFNINKQVYMGKILTLAVKVDGELYAGSVEVIETTPAEANVIQGNGFNAVIKITASGDKSYVEITPLLTTPVIVEWAAIYEGEYTADSLPPYVPKGYSVELAECQRYFFQVGAYSPIGNGYSVGSEDARIAIVTPVEMRNMPSLNDSFDLIIVGNGVSKPVTSTTVGSKSGNIVRLNIVSSGLTAGYTYSAHTGGTGALQLGADL